MLIITLATLALYSAPWTIRSRPRAIVATETASTATGELALAFGAALSRAWAGDGLSLAQLVPDVAVDTPVWTCKDRATYEAELSNAARFFGALSTPTLIVLSHSDLDGDGTRAKVEWMLGVEWPAVWRPRINLLGTSVLTVSRNNGGVPTVVRVKETWHQTPLEVFLSQVCPSHCSLHPLPANPLPSSPTCTLCLPPPPPL